MTVYYVNGTAGNNSNNGLTPGTAWATVAKALGASGISSGDTVYIAPGTYRETVTVSVAPTAETKVIGDVTGQYNGVIGGEIRITNYTTNDSTAPTNSSPMNLNGKNFLTFENITFINGGSGSCYTLDGYTVGGSHDITLRNCTFLAVRDFNVINKANASAAANWTIERCILYQMSSNSGFYVEAPLNSSADYNMNILVQNSLIIGIGIGNGIEINPAGGSGSFKGGGINIANCTLIGYSIGVYSRNANQSTTYPITVNYSIIMGSTCMQANTSGQIVENYNYLQGSTLRTTVSAGANSQTAAAIMPLLELGQSILYGMQLRPAFAPVANSPLLGFGSGGTLTPPTVDFNNRPRPAGGGSTSNGIGALERHDTAVKETGTVQSGSNAINITGPGDHDFSVPVDAQATTISIYARYDTNHGSGNKPQMLIVNGGECGVADATVTMTAAVDTWEQLSLNFTPTAKGVITVRLVSRAAAGNGKAFFDDFTIA